MSCFLHCGSMLSRSCLTANTLLSSVCRIFRTLPNAPFPTCATKKESTASFSKQTRAAKEKAPTGHGPTPVPILAGVLQVEKQKLSDRPVLGRSNCPGLRGTPGSRTSAAQPGRSLPILPRWKSKHVGLGRIGSALDQTRSESGRGERSLILCCPRTQLDATGKSAAVQDSSILTDQADLPSV